MENGGPSKVILNRYDKLKTVKDVVEFYSNKDNIKLVEKELLAIFQELQSSDIMWLTIIS